MSAAGHGGLMHSELAKLLTTRTTALLVGAEVVLGAVATSGAIASGALSTSRLGSGNGVRDLLLHAGLTAALTLVIGVSISAGEYRHGTIVDTFLTVPRRSRVITAKVGTGTVVGLVAGLASALSVGITAMIWYAAKGISYGGGAGVPVRSLLGVVGWHTMFCVIGVAVGFLIRNQAGAVIAAVTWLFVAETAVSGLAVRLARWLPATAARALGNDTAHGLLPQLGGLFVLLAWSAAAVTAATLVVRRRDLT
jgi:ABC-2 type transport system permease protein